MYTNILKIVVSGSYAAGKTQFIRTISDIETVETEAPVSQEDELELKSATTVAFDFGILKVNDELALYLFGTPGQERFDYMWEVLANGCIGYVVLVDSTRPAHLREARTLITAFNAITSVPYIVVANKQDDATAMPVDYVQKRLDLPAHVPVLPCIASDRESVKEVLLTLLSMAYQATGEAVEAGEMEVEVMDNGSN